jgi:hypothetical protein
VVVSSKDSGTIIGYDGSGDTIVVINVPSQASGADSLVISISKGQFSIFLYVQLLMLLP